MDKKMRKAIQNLVTGSCLLCFGLILIYLVIPQQIKVRSKLSAAAGSGVSSRGFPLFSCWIIVIASALLVVNSLVKLIALRKETKQNSAENAGQ